MAVVSICWEDATGSWAPYAGQVTYRSETIAPGYIVNLVSAAWPFDQGVEAWRDENPKEEFKGQPTLDLFPENANLPLGEWCSLMELLAHNELVMHPMKFDCDKFNAGVRVWPGQGRDLQPSVLWDTMNVNGLIWPLEPRGLKSTHERLYGSDYGDASKQVKAYLRKAKLPSGRWDLVPWDIIGPYADMDAVMTKMIELRQRWEINCNDAASWLWDEGEFPGDKDPRDAVYAEIERRMKTSRWLYRMEQRGLPYDQQASRLAGEQALEVAQNLAKKLPFAPVEAKRFFFEPGYTSKKGVKGPGLVPYQMTEPSSKFPQGQPSMTAEVLARMVDDGVEYAEAYAVYTKIETAVSMWYFGYADKVGPDGRLRTVFRQDGTRSTRFSVERVNLQAIPQDYRMSGYSELAGIPSPRGIISATVRDHYPGWRLWELDLQQAELRVGAWMAKCYSMLEMMANGDDMHAITTQKLFKIEEDDPKWKLMRQVGKRGNFSLGFGAGGKTFKQMISKETGIMLQDHESFRIVRDWNALYPEWGRAIKITSRRVERRMRDHGHGWIQFANKNRRWFQPYEESHKAFNQRVQGSLAQFGIDWGLASEDLLMEQGLHETIDVGGAGLILPIHDSLNILVPDSEEGEVLIDEVVKIGTELWKQHFPGVPGGIDVKSW